MHERNRQGHLKKKNDILSEETFKILRVHVDKYSTIYLDKLC